MKRRPVGYVATCQCARDVGVIDLERTPRSDAGRLLGKWIAAGCTLTPKFGGNWAVEVSRCVCEPTPRPAWDGKYRDRCFDGHRCLDGCYSNEPCRRDAPISIPSQET